MNRQQSTRSAAYPPQPPRERGTWRAFALAALMHVLLALFLYHGVQWQNSTPAGAEAELWTEVPDVPAPRPVVTPAPPAKVAPPAPPVRDEQADIALQQKKRQQEAAAREALLEQQRRAQQLKQQEEEARRAQLAAQQAAALAAEKAAERDKQKQAAKLKQQQLAEQQRLEQQKLEQQKLQQQKQAQLEAQQAAKAKADAQAKAKAEAAAHAKADAAAKAKLDRERNARLAQMQGLAGAGEGGGQGLAKSGTGTGSGGNAASPGYADKVRRRVKPNIVWGGERAGLTTIVKIRCTPSGDLLSVSVSRSSGNSGWDQAVVNAIQASVPLPPDTDGHTPSSITITFKAAE
ncbi:cell envelope integrity protein TolA [Burkholderia seminalis]|uniref:cell envelope integrity protein TolA n=1 Tax=Burkholderia seminalis TaxID=488731 RepID=UPI00264C54AD|nr:cell envelope integrity protein TolA [Burkholderia seminalis]MDN7586478.1 cell envelope integrity protein TolA [Burkholderia seminalis]